MRIVINENQRGFLFKAGRFKKMLVPGRHYAFGRNKEVIYMELDEVIYTEGYNLEVFLQDDRFREETVVTEVGEQKLMLHYADDKFFMCLRTGRYAFWNVFQTHTFKEVDISQTMADRNIPSYIFDQIPQDLYTKLEVAEFEKALIYFDQKLERVLDEGVYYFWNNGTKIKTMKVDTRILQMDVTGQEIMTLDKVALRINFVCHYRITDVVKIHTEVKDYQEQLHILIQMALREFIGAYRLDEILENKNKIAAFVFEKLKEREESYYVEFFDAGVKDIILPGEIRDIMNTVLLAEKKAQANVITRREEVASTRSLLNTAKLMEENKTLYKLKELEHLEKICENVGNITVSGGGDLLSQLASIIKPDMEK